MECSGDIRVVVKTITLTSERNAFVWFNSQFVTDRLTVFNEFEMDRSKSSSFSSMDSSSSFSSMDSSSTTQDSDGVAVSMDSSSFNLFSSTAAPTPLPEEVERELFLRCVFDDDALLETEELARWRAERAGAEQSGEVVASDRVLPMKPISLIQKASTQIITSTRNLISRVSSTSSRPPAHDQRQLLAPHLRALLPHPQSPGAAGATRSAGGERAEGGGAGGDARDIGSAAAHQGGDREEDDDAHEKPARERGDHHVVQHSDGE